MEKKSFEIVSKKEDMISADLCFNDAEDGGENFPLKYIEFPDFYTKNDNG